MCLCNACVKWHRQENKLTRRLLSSSLLIFSFIPLALRQDFEVEICENLDRITLPWLYWCQNRKQVWVKQHLETSFLFHQKWEKESSCKFSITRTFAGYDISMKIKSKEESFQIQFDPGLAGTSSQSWITETCACKMNQGWVTLWWIAVFFSSFFKLLSLVVPCPIRGSETWSFWVLSILFQSWTKRPSVLQSMFTIMFTSMAIRCFTCFHPIIIPIMTQNQILHKRLGFWCRVSLVHTSRCWWQIFDTGQGFHSISFALIVSFFFHVASLTLVSV